MKKHYLFSLLLCLIVSLTTAGQQLIEDINLSGSSNPKGFIEYNGNLYFTADDGTHGNELWVYNPILSTTTMVSDLLPGSSGSNPSYKAVSHGKLYFAAQVITGGTFSELYVYDDVTNTITQVIPPTSFSSFNEINPKYMLDVNGVLYFEASTNFGVQNTRSTLATYDGIAFTKIDMNFNVTAGSQMDGPMYFLNDNVYLSASAGTNILHFYNINNGAKGSISSMNRPKDVIIYANDLFANVEPLVNQTMKHYKYNTLNQTAQEASMYRSKKQPVGHNNKLYFPSDINTTLTNTLTIYDITNNTTTYKELFNGDNSVVSNLIKLNGKIYFQAETPGSGREMHVYDPLTDIITLAVEITPGSGDAAPTELFVFNNEIYFQSADGVNGREFWKYDGSFVTNNSPTTVGTIPNISQTQNSTTNQTIDLTQYFADAEDGASGLTYSVTSTDPSYFSASISGTNLLVNFNTGFGGPDTVTVQVTDSGGLSVTQSFTVTVSQATCGQPTNVTASNIVFETADISWTAVPQAVNGYTWYVMIQGEVPNQGGTNAVATGGVSDSVTTASVTGLTFNTAYDVYVQTFCADNTASNLSIVTSFTTLSCESVTNLAITKTTDTSVSISWTASATAFNGYRWWLMNPGDVPGVDTEIQTQAVSAGTVATVSNLSASTSYDLYLQSVCDTGFGSALNAFVSFTTTASCDAPTNVSATNITTSSLDLSWTASPDAANGYRWYILPSGSTDTAQAIETNVTTVTSVTGVNASNLSAGTSYDAYVVSRCSATINSGLSLVETFTMPSALPLITLGSVVSNVLFDESLSNNLVITLSASQQATQDIDVTLAFSGSASYNSDYSIISNTVTIPQGASSYTLPIPLVDDNELEAIENIIIDIVGVANGIEDGVQQTQLLIQDNEPSNISFTDSGQTLVTLANDVVLGDFDNNTGLDALFAKANFSDRVLFNNGSGVLSNSGQTLGLESSTLQMAVGDFDGSGPNDVVLAKGLSCDVLLNNSGIYSPSVTIGSGNTNNAVEVEDIDLDGLDDIIIGKVGEVEVYINDYITNNFMLDFSLSQTLSFGTSSSTVNDMKISDFNQDSNLDLVVATLDSSYVFYGTGGGQFNTTAILLPNEENASGVDVFDIDNNGFKDFVFAQAFTSFPNQIVLNNGTSGFSLMPLTPMQSFNSTDVAFVDLDNDNDMDVVFSNSTRNIFWENIGGAFAGNEFVISADAFNSKALDVGDIDGDGDMDVIVANGGNSSTTSSRIWFNDLQTLSNNDFDTQNNVMLYPNPVKNEFIIKTQNSEIEKVEVFNVQGQLVKLFKPSESYNISDLESGLYFVSITSNQAISTVKILKE